MGESLDEIIRRVGLVYTCEVPAEIGKPTKIEMKRGKLIVRTDAGHTMIVPSLGGK